MNLYYIDSGDNLLLPSRWLLNMPLRKKRIELKKG